MDSGIPEERNEDGTPLERWKDNAYSIESRFQSLVATLANKGDENVDRLTALVWSTRSFISHSTQFSPFVLCKNIRFFSCQNF